MTTVVTVNERVAVVFLDPGEVVQEVLTVKATVAAPPKEEGICLDLPGVFENEAAFAEWLNENIALEDQDGWIDIARFEGDAYSIAICTERPVHVLHMNELARYFFEGPFAGEYYGYECVDQRGGYGRLFLLDVDTTKCRHDDLGDALPGIWPHFKDGSPIRKTNRAGVGTKGTRAVEGLGCNIWVAFN